jgi:hypothetical protein
MCMLPSVYSTGMVVSTVLAGSMSTTYCYLALACSALVMLVWMGAFYSVMTGEQSLLSSASMATVSVSLAIGTHLMCYVGLAVL